MSTKVVDRDNFTLALEAEAKGQIQFQVRLTLKKYPANWDPDMDLPELFREYLFEKPAVVTATIRLREPLRSPIGFLVALARQVEWLYESPYGLEDRAAAYVYDYPFDDNDEDDGLPLLEYDLLDEFPWSRDEVDEVYEEGDPFDEYPWDEIDDPCEEF